MMNEKYYNTFGGNLIQFPDHIRFIENCNWYTFYDFENLICKSILKNIDIILDRERNYPDTNAREKTIDQLIKMYGKQKC